MPVCCMAYPPCTGVKVCVELPSSILLDCLGCSDLSLEEDVWRDRNMWVPGEEMESLWPFFFLMTLILCLRSSCSNSCLFLNKAKPLSQKGWCHTSEHVKTAVHHSQYVTVNTVKTERRTNYSVLIAFEKCISFFHVISGAVKNFTSFRMQSVACLNLQ